MSHNSYAFEPRAASSTESVTVITTSAVIMKFEVSVEHLLEKSAETLAKFGLSCST
jgi:hypothetical protein